MTRKSAAIAATVLFAASSIGILSLARAQTVDYGSYSMHFNQRVDHTMFASLNGAQETPPVSTLGNGTAMLGWIDDDLWYDITVNNLTTPITAAHFHRGAPGEAGPVVEPIQFNGNHAVGTWPGLSPDMKQAVLDGKIYINVHTQQYPNGEIRGQIQQGATNTPTSSTSSLSSSSYSSLSSNSSSSSFSSVSSASSVSSSYSSLSSSSSFSSSQPFSSASSTSLASSSFGGIASSFTCQGRAATVYVQNGKIVGGHDAGQTYAGVLMGTGGPDVIMGTDGSDSIAGMEGNDIICGGAGDDRIQGSQDDDIIEGGAGADWIGGGHGRDVLRGGPGTDNVWGDSEDDVLWGEADNDHLDGNDGNDSLDGGFGVDHAIGGNGIDACTAETIEWCESGSVTATSTSASSISASSFSSISSNSSSSAFSSYPSLSSPSSSSSSSVSYSFASSASSSPTNFLSSLSGSKETPPVTTPGFGMGRFQWIGNDLFYAISVGNLTSPITAAHFHRGLPGEAGPAIQPITFFDNYAVGTWYNVPAQDRQDINDGKFYVNVHTTQNPNGEVRGQVEKM